MADNSPYNHSYIPLRNVDEGDELAPLQSDPKQPQPNPTTGQPFNQQTQPPPQQPLTVQAQPPPPQTGVQYYTQPYPAPQVVQTQPQMPIVATQQTVTGPKDTSTKLPKYAFVTSVVATIIFTLLCWLPGLLCLVPATVLSIMALSKEDDKLKEAKRFSIISFILVLIFAISYPILVTTVILASVFGYMCDYLPRESAYYGYSYYIRPYACG